ncbi:MAG: J domain-containing protein [Chloroflexota bacterium]|nr:MAG: J domain-containing protein [Chloroflexota bacterium]
MSCNPIDRYCRVLDLKPDASLDEIKQAYRGMAKTWHPDRFPADSGLRNTAEVRMKQINEAYAALVDWHSSRPAAHPLDNATGSTPVPTKTAPPRTRWRPPRRRKRHWGAPPVRRNRGLHLVPALLSAAVFVALMTGWAALESPSLGQSFFTIQSLSTFRWIDADDQGSEMSATPAAWDNPYALPASVNPAFTDDPPASADFSPTTQPGFLRPLR